MHEAKFEGARPVDGYGPGFFRVGGDVIRGAMILSAEAAQGWAGFEDEAALDALVGAVDILLLGMGAEVAMPPKPLRERLKAAGIGVEVMATGPACRTYNVLLVEGRRVALAALPV